MSTRWVARHLQFDNMHQRTVEGPLSGGVQWTRRSIGFRVPDDAGSIHYGVMLMGAGTLWARGVDISEVDASEVGSPSKLPKRPTNLGFGEAA